MPTLWWKASPIDLRRIDKPSEEQRRPNRNNIPRGMPNEHVTVTTTTIAKSTTKGTVLLKTARCMAVNSSNSIPVRVIFDNRSWQSYVSLSVTSRLNLQPVNSENLHINSFGDTSYQKQKCNVVKLCLQTRNHEEVELYAVNFPVICSPLPSRVKRAWNWQTTSTTSTTLNQLMSWLDPIITGTLCREIPLKTTRVWLQSTANLDGCCPDQYTINHSTWLFPVDAIRCLRSKMKNWWRAWRNSGSRRVLE